MSKIKKSFRKNMFKGVEFSELVEMEQDDVIKMMNARKRRRYARGMPESKYGVLIKKLIGRLSFLSS